MIDSSAIDVSIPRDRQSRFELALMVKYRHRLPSFDRKVIAPSARGKTTRDIQSHLREPDGAEISPKLVSQVTDAGLVDVTRSQNRPLE